MKLPIQAQPIIRSVSTAKIKVSDGVNPSIDFKCIIKCAAGIAQCISSPNPVQCLIQAGLGDCVSCL
jgi:hypothetical protein